MDLRATLGKGNIKQWEEVVRYVYTEGKQV